MDDSPQFEPPVTAAPGGTSGLPREPPSSFSFRDRGNKRCIDKQAGEYQGSWRHISELWWDVLCPAMIPIGVYWPLGVVVGILDSFPDPGLIGLISVGEFFDALISSVQMV